MVHHLINHATKWTWLVWEMVLGLTGGGGQALWNGVSVSQSTITYLSKCCCCCRLLFMISSFASAASWRPHHVLCVVLRCHRRSKSTGTHSRHASLFGVHRSRRVARRCNPSHACCCGMVPRLIGTGLAGSIGHGAGPFPVAGWWGH